MTSQFNRLLQHLRLIPTLGLRNDGKEGLCNDVQKKYYFSSMERGGFTYITTNKNNTVLYVGATSVLKERTYEHQTKKYKKSFTARYNADKLVYYEYFSSIEEAIAREKQLKAGSRKKKLDLINAFNPDWKDLFDDL
jgi:putative endonuclease